MPYAIALLAQGAFTSFRRISCSAQMPMRYIDEFHLCMFRVVLTLQLAHFLLDGTMSFQGRYAQVL